MLFQILWTSTLWPAGCRAQVITTFHAAKRSCGFPSNFHIILFFLVFNLSPRHADPKCNVGILDLWKLRILFSRVCWMNKRWLNYQERALLNSGIDPLCVTHLNGIMVWSPLSLALPSTAASLAHTVCLKTAISVFSQHEISPIKPSVISTWGPWQLCTKQEKNCHCWNGEECLFWDGASTVLAEELNNVARVCVGIAVKQEIALEKKENK